MSVCDTDEPRLAACEPQPAPHVPDAVARAKLARLGISAFCGSQVMPPTAEFAQFRRSHRLPRNHPLAPQPSVGNASQGALASVKMLRNKGHVSATP